MITYTKLKNGALQADVGGGYKVSYIPERKIKIESGDWFEGTILGDPIKHETKPESTAIIKDVGDGVYESVMIEAGDHRERYEELVETLKRSNSK